MAQALLKKKTFSPFPCPPLYLSLPAATQTPTLSPPKSNLAPAWQSWAVSDLGEGGACRDGGVQRPVTTLKQPARNWLVNTKSQSAASFYSPAVVRTPNFFHPGHCPSKGRLLTVGPEELRLPWRTVLCISPQALSWSRPPPLWLESAWNDVFHHFLYFSRFRVQKRSGMAESGDPGSMQNT